MQSLFIFFLLIGNHFFSPGRSTDGFIDPTGTYILKGEITKNKIMGHYGELRVKLLDRYKVAISFYISKGYPDYESGSFTDTVAYDDNFAKYTPAKDSDCSILFVFEHNMVQTEQTYTDPHCACGFSKGVMISTVFQKFSSEEPIIQDLSAHGDIR